MFSLTYLWSVVNGGSVWSHQSASSMNTGPCLQGSQQSSNVHLPTARPLWAQTSSNSHCVSSMQSLRSDHGITHLLRSGNLNRIPQLVIIAIAIIIKNKPIAYIAIVPINISLNRLLSFILSLLESPLYLILFCSYRCVL